MSWQIDPAHSEITFTARHMMISKVRGQFESFNGAVDFDPENPTKSMVNITIEADSINTREEQRDNHLKSPDFLNTAEFPVITFKSKKIEQVDDERGKLFGELTIRDVTKPVELEVEYAGLAKSPWGTVNAGFSASTTINRKDWGLNWNQALETGGVLVSDKIKIEIELEIIRQVESVPA